MNTSRISTASTIVVLVAGSLLIVQELCQSHRSWLKVGWIVAANCASIAVLVLTRRVNKQIRLQKMRRRLGVPFEAKDSDEYSN